ncbi:MAG: peptidoglycan D,D-transpeptidase FtsI family protein [Chloroflexota bacterium]
MRNNISQVGLGLLAGLALCGLAMGYWVIVQGSSLLSRGDNGRRLTEGERGRGAILARGGEVLARTTLRDGIPVREYPLVSAAHVIGIHSPRLGNTGLEDRYDELLRGARGDVIQQLRQRFLSAPLHGADVVTTIDSRVQQAAADAMGESRGAVVALDPRSGEILALLSRPGFDPNTLEQSWELMRADQSAPLLNRAIQATYPPGSTFKVITAAAALDLGIIDPEVEFRCTTSAQIDALSVDCRNHAHLPVVNYRQAFAWSCNRTFALTGLFLPLGAPLNSRLDDRAVAARPWSTIDVEAAGEQLMGYARAFGFERTPTFDLPVTLSRVKGDGRWYPSLLAQTGFGQGEVTATPLEMALVAATIANDGVVPVPYLAERARLQNGADRPLKPILASALSAVQQRAIRPSTATDLRRFMVESVEYAYAQQAKIPGITVAGKTGTAETGLGEVPHAWFIGFAPADHPRVAVAVIMEHRGSGAEVATPAARRVMAAALQS